MTAYYVNEAAFGLPDADITDRTVTRLVFDAGEGASIALTVHRQPLPAGESLAALFTRKQQEAERALPSHAVLFRREVEMAGAPAIEIAAEWRDKDRRLYTRQAHVALDGAWLILAANASLDARARCDALMDRVVATFRRRG
jgi:hypothetical protein